MKQRFYLWLRRRTFLARAYSAAYIGWLIAEPLILIPVAMLLEGLVAVVVAWKAQWVETLAPELADRMLRRVPAMWKFAVHGQQLGAEQPGRKS